MRTLNRLKVTKINGLPPGRHHDGGGLYLVIGKVSGRSWVFRFRRDGRLHDLGLGPAHTVSLKAARERAAAHRSLLYADADYNPVKVKLAKRIERILAAAKSISFEKAAEQYIASHKDGWRSSRNEEQWRRSLAIHAFPAIGKLPVAEIDTGLVLKVLQPIWPTKTQTASLVRGRIEAILDWARVRNYRNGENPARWAGHLEALLPNKSKVRAVEHLAAMPYAEIGTFMAELHRQEGVAARALEFVILIAARTAEVTGARWSEIDLGERVWIVPANRMKAGTEHRVPLSEAALTILEAMAANRVNDLISPGSRNAKLGPLALRRVLAALGRRGLTVHGFRSAFSDWAAERSNYPREVVEMALAHTIANKVEAAYRRGDLFERRRQLAQAWADYIGRSEGAGQVIPIGARG